jgi:RHS repeat-associated protein
VATVNQTQNAGTWVPLGSYAFTEGNTHTVTLTDQAAGTVVADAVKLVRPRDGQTDAEKQDFTYAYDPNGNLTAITDASPAAAVDQYAVGYDGINQVQQVQEKLDGAVRNTTAFTYNENGLPQTVGHDRQFSRYFYGSRDLVSSVRVGALDNDPNAKVTRYGYTGRKQIFNQTKANGNRVDYTYFLDQLVKTQTERKADTTTLVAQHTYDYDLNGNRIRDVASTMNADNHAAYLNTTADHVYDPRDRIATKTVTGNGAGVESYLHDANNNVIEQTIKNVTTTFGYDRDRLITTTITGAAASAYNYDPFGRLDTVTTGGQVTERNIYDGFDHIVEHRKTTAGTTATTRYTYDPLDRTTSKTSDVGTPRQKTTTFSYLGLSSEVLDETVAGQLTKTYQYTPWGQRLSQTTHNTDGTTEDGFYGYNPHTDVEQVTDPNGNTKATYGYTAYGNNDTTQFTGVDKPDPQDPTKEPFNAYRYNAKRFDTATGTYDMGFRDYSPGLNRFLTRDTYNGALADLNLGLNPYTGNRYAFTAGNPITNIELDGHEIVNDGGGLYVPPACTGSANACEGPRETQEIPQTITRDQAEQFIYGRDVDPVKNPGEAMTAFALTECVNYNDQAGCDLFQERVNPEPHLLDNILRELSGANDAEDCTNAEISGCAWLIAGFFGIGKLGKVLKGLKLTARGGKAANAPRNLGRSYGTNATVVQNPGVEIRGFQGSQQAGHALNQIINRGVRPQALLEAQRNPVAVVEQTVGGGRRYLYIGRQASFVVTPDGQVVTAWNAAENTPFVRQIINDAT